LAFLNSVAHAINSYIMLWVWVPRSCSGGAIGVAALRSCEKLPPYLVQPTPGSSKIDPLLAKIKPISNSGNTSVITYLRRGKKPAVKWQWRERSETM